ncbi:NAD-dependent epimerase/dehydratase family protein [Clostridium estertheticum]|uniref:NAD-dependent epimerase/dehydratase family protein n=1 Tax=Clostridium estertheticum TaxID=238834 RepID=UPI001C7D134F|nr:NAD-dependent epimerase/dehydratase family protein [Clostridium estertheticum]MBX4270560.1 NAD-dependent epimerase/dehydratase family protein [Clostridium estertheticum]WLC80086.1 NAD-dependent epimerase/dehydratase family protein [Clostridium estertheticum]
MKVLITGGAGFISSHIADLLIENNYDVCVIDNLSHGKIRNLDPKAKFYNVDIREKEVFDIFEKEKPDVVVHNAAQISVSNSVENPLEDASINIIGTINILEASRQFGVKKIIYPASAAIFGEPEYLPIDEKHPLNMISPYGVSKHTVEHYLGVYKKSYNIDYVVLRYSNVYGPRQDSSGEGGVVSIFCEKLINGQAPFIYGDGEQIRDFVYVKDVAEANLMAIEKNKSGIYNVCTNSKTTINNLFGYIRDLIGKDISPVYVKEREGDIKNSYMTYDKIGNEIGWRPEYAIHSGLKETLEYYLDNI